MNLLKELLSRNKGQSEKVEERPNENLTPSEAILSTYQEDGRKISREAHGNHNILETCLENVYQDFIKKASEDETVQGKAHEPTRQKLKELEIEKNRKSIFKELKDEELQKIASDINKIENDIAIVPDDPKRFGLDVNKRPKVQFYIGLFIILPLTLYLIVFYMSASYSAFFKDFGINDGLIAAIFDGQAAKKALTDENGGWIEVIFICTIPFVFMGLGYLIHMFEKVGGWKSTVKIISLFAVTFIFDFILAYQIEMKIFEFNKMPGEVYNLSIAFQSVQFWGIIFAGFVVYVIWGLVLNFVIREHENFDIIKIFIKSKREEIKILEKSKKEVERKIEIVKEDLKELEIRINDCYRQLSEYVVDKSLFKRLHTQFMKGWMLAISSDLQLTKQSVDALIERCKEVERSHLNSIGLNE